MLPDGTHLSPTEVMFGILTEYLHCDAMARTRTRARVNAAALVDGSSSARNLPNDRLSYADWGEDEYRRVGRVLAAAGGVKLLGLRSHREAVLVARLSVELEMKWWFCSPGSGSNAMKRQRKALAELKQMGTCNVYAFPTDKLLWMDLFLSLHCAIPPDASSDRTAPCRFKRCLLYSCQELAEFESIMARKGGFTLCNY